MRVFRGITQKGSGKTEGEIKVSNSTIRFKPLKPLHYGAVYKIIVTTGIRSIYGDILDLPYERRYNTSPYPTKKDPDILVYSESHGPESYVQIAKGVLKIGVSSFVPLTHLDVNGQRVKLKDKSIVQLEIPFRFTRKKLKVDYLVTALTNEGKARKRFTIHYGYKPIPKPPPFQMVSILKYSTIDNLYSSSSDVENIGAAKMILTLVPMYKVHVDPDSFVNLQAVFLRDKVDNSDYAEKEVSYTGLALDWMLLKTVLGTWKFRFGYNDISTGNANVLAGEENAQSEKFGLTGFDLMIGKDLHYILEVGASIKKEESPSSEDDDTSGMVQGLMTAFQFNLLGAKNKLKLTAKLADTVGQYKVNTNSVIEVRQDYTFGNWFPSWSYSVSDTQYKNEDTRLTVDGIAVQNTLGTLLVKLDYKLFSSLKIGLEYKNKKQASNFQSYNYEATHISALFTHLF